MDKKSGMKLKNIKLLNNNAHNNYIKASDSYVEFKREEIGQSIVARFEQQVEKYGNKIAIKDSNKAVTYDELNNCANHIALNILSMTCNPVNTVNYEDTIHDYSMINESVALVFEHGIDMITGMLGVLKCGKIYVPLDPTYPQKRLTYILENSNCRYIVINNKNINLLKDILEDKKDEIKIINIDSIDYKPKKENIGVYIHPNQIAYILYTSGSTGVPKGVMQNHKNVLHFISTYTNNLKISSDDKLSLLSSYNFDASVMDIYSAILNGATLYPYDIKMNKNILNLIDWINNEKITIYHSIPTVYRYMLDALDENYKFNYVRLVVMGGEAVYKNDVEKYKIHFGDECVFINGLGPTESTVTLQNFINKGTKIIRESVPVGFPVIETQVLIINENNEEAGINEIGELYYKSEYIALGYCNNEEQTKKAFICDPLTGQGRVYKTGDIGRKLLDGSLEFIGRKDFQVKIRGYRIELGEIEGILDRVSDIGKSIVIGKQDENKDYYLVAYYTNKTNNTIDKDYLKGLLKENLPEYMVPAYFVEMEKMPQTPNGKIDRKSLPEINVDKNLTEYEAPKNEVQEILVKLWSEVLGVEHIGINDNFFDLGGHSLKATMLTSKIYRELNREISIAELFKYPTIKLLDGFINMKDKKDFLSITKVEEKQYYETSSAQKRMYMLQQFDKNSTAYNMSTVFELEGTIDIQKIENTFNQIVNRHDALRTYFESMDSYIVQKIDSNFEFKLKHIINDDNIKHIIDDFIRPFNLDKNPLFRVELVESNSKNYLLMDMHHIISDGISINILVNEFKEIYNGKRLEPLRLKYKDFAAWQNKYLQSDSIKNQEKYWIDKFSDDIPVLNLPVDYERPLIQSYDGDNISFEVNEEITEKLRNITRKTNTTMYMVLLSAFNILLYKCCGQEDIVVGTPVAGRLHADIQNIMGMFVNTIALRNKPEASKKYIDFLQELKENSLLAYENQSYQFEELVEKLKIRKDTSRNPLFDVMFSMVDSEIKEEIKINGMSLKLLNNENNISKFDITLNALEDKKKICLNFEYCTKLFKRSTIERLSYYYIKILESVTSNIYLKLSDIEILAENEKHQLLHEFNDTNRDYPKNITIQELFEEQVEKVPEKLAIVYEENSITYKELNERANALGRTLRQKGITNESIVAIMVEKSIDVIIGILAIIKAGGAYLPIDPSHPKNRVNYILENSKADILITEAGFLDDLNINCEIINIKDQNLYSLDKTNLKIINKQLDLLYVLYTSGTTGNPKGVMVEQKNLTNMVFGWKEKYKLDEFKVNLLQMASVAFDVFTGDICRSLLTGGTMYICPVDVRINMQELYNTIVKYQINILESTPSLIITFMDYISENKLDLDSLRILILGSDSCPIEDYKKLVKNYGKTMRILNSYGITEATIDSSYYEATIDNIPSSLVNTPIGKPLPNCEFYILDNALKLQPVGVIGELYIGGAGVTRGYYNNEKLTSSKFIESPFRVGSTIYKTGDLARWLADGNVEFLGRIDNQVKIRGFRIELGEIENKLLQHEAIKEAIVLVKENSKNQKYICAYVVSKKDNIELELKDYLRESLPEYMIPNFFVVLEKISLTVNGKVNRRALPEPNFDAMLEQYEAPRNAVEETIAKIWSDVLGIDKIGISDNFFDIGGHSLNAMSVITKIHKELNKEIPLNELFKTPTIKGLSNYVNHVEKSVCSVIEKVDEKEYYDTSSAQKRMYILQQYDLNSTAYNLPVVFKIEGILNKEKTDEALKILVKRHESLRTSFETIDGNIVQKVNKDYEFSLDCLKEESSIEDIIQDFIRPFDLQKPSLFRVKLVENNKENYLLIDMHHIIADGVSVNLLINEFIDIYNGNSLQTLKLQYKDFAAWQNAYLNSDSMKKQEEYWTNTFSGEIPILDIHTDYERTIEQNFTGDSLDFEIGEEITTKLRELSKKTGTTMHMIILSAFIVLISKYSEQEDIIIGTPIAGRPHSDLENIIGMFVNTLALRNKPEQNKRYIDFLMEVKENSLKAYDNQSYQFETLVEKLGIKHKSRNPLFDVFYVWDDKPVYKLKIDDVNLLPLQLNDKIAKFDLTLSGYDAMSKVGYSIEYSTQLFNQDTIELMGERLSKLIESIASDSEVLIKDLDWRTDFEKEISVTDDFEFNF